MNTSLKRTALALAVASFAAAGVAQANDWHQPPADVNTSIDTDINITGDIEAVGEIDVSGELVVGGEVNIDYNYDYDDNFVRNVNVEKNILRNETTNNEVNNTSNTTTDINTDVDISLVDDRSYVEDRTLTDDRTYTEDRSWTEDRILLDDRSYVEDVTVTRDDDRSYTEDVTVTRDDDRSYTEDVSVSREDNRSYNEDVSLTVSQELDVYQRIHQEEENVNVDSDIRRERNEHGRSVYLSKDLSLDSDISFNGDIEVTGELDVDSAAIAVVDGRQTIVGNEGNNDMLANDAEIGDDAGGGATGNLHFNVAAGDNNMQDNAAALSAADASFAFGMADAEIFNNQLGANNTTNNMGVTNDASVGGAAFDGATGNIAVNVASGNNNSQRNSLAASVAVTGYAQASVASDQVSSGNVTYNEGMFETREATSQLNITGTISGVDGSQATYDETGMSYQHRNMYPSTWGADGNDGNHPDSPRLGHVDFDIDTQGATPNPVRADEIDEFGQAPGGLAFDNVNEGVIDMSEVELAANLSGSASFLYQVEVQATNTASLNGTAFSGASGNIGVNIASGSGNLQSNSLALAVAQPSDGGGGGGGGGGPGG